MIAAIRIRGQVKLKTEVIDALYRLRLRRKYACVVLHNPSTADKKLLQKLRDYVAFGEITPEQFTSLVEARGQKVPGSKADLKKAAADILAGKNYEDAGIKPFFRLHPPRGGIESKKHFGVGKGVLGDHKKDLNKLMERML